MVDAERALQPMPEIGHVVNVRGSDTYMCVEEIDGRRICCVWMAGGRVERDQFSPEVLFNRTIEARDQNQAIMAAEEARAKVREAARREYDQRFPWYWPFKTA